MNKTALTATVAALAAAVTLAGCSYGRAPVNYRFDHGVANATVEDTVSWFAGVAARKGWRVCAENPEGSMLSAVLQWDGETIQIDVDADEKGLRMRPDLENTTLQGPAGRAHRSVNNLTKALYKELDLSLKLDGFVPQKAEVPACSK